nr:heme-binding protein [Novosphingobium sp. SG751A]
MRLGAKGPVARLLAQPDLAADGYAITVAVTDAQGQLKAALAADGPRENGIYMAMHKTLTVVGFRISTLELRQRIEKDPALLDQVKPNMSLLPGGVPIFGHGAFLGAIATSGASAHIEEKCAADGIAGIASQL